MNTLIEMAALWRARPAADDAPDVVAAWYEAKGRLHEHLAAAGGPERVDELAYAAQAYEHARRLLASSSTASVTRADLALAGGAA